MLTSLKLALHEPFSWSWSCSLHGPSGQLGMTLFLRVSLQVFIDAEKKSRMGWLFYCIRFLGSLIVDSKLGLRDLDSWRAFYFSLFWACGLLVGLLLLFSSNNLLYFTLKINKNTQWRNPPISLFFFCLNMAWKLNIELGYHKITNYVLLWFSSAIQDMNVSLLLQM
jgi:hypothetical protein